MIMIMLYDYDYYYDYDYHYDYDYDYDDIMMIMKLAVFIKSAKVLRRNFVPGLWCCPIDTSQPK